MIHITGALSLDGELMELTLPSVQSSKLIADGLYLFPGLIDPHVHFRTPGMEHKEDWRTAARAAICGGYTTVFDMPNTIPPTVTAETLQAKKALIDQQLAKANIPLHYALYFGADKHHLNEIYKIKQDVIGIKVFMGCSTGNLVIDDDESLHKVFKIASELNLLIAVHAEDEAMIQQRKAQFSHSKQYSDHSFIRNAEVAASAVEKAIQLARIYGTRLYILHVSTAAELMLIKSAKVEGLPVYAETTPHHLFLHEGAYADLQGKAVVNPPLRNSEQHIALWEAIHDGTIDTIGSDHAPHLESEKERPYGECPSGMPGIETTLPLLLTAYHAGKLSLNRIVELTCTRAREIFKLTPNDDYVLVDLYQTKIITNAELQTKCKWSAFAGRALTGWPVYTIIDGQVFDLL
ncbi:MAG: dihydroorotase [Gammaproteobacteria bacterium RIFCSPHIGHO2_12_FULL_37_14]|nr:MAG: dihydroorotase [Gammaproteobacteria bacterium RIFCSPHIGHO2_12_FULL_37_14]